MKTHRIPVVILALALILSACNMPTAQPTVQSNPNAVFTAAAQTVVAQLTQNALLNPTSPPAATDAPPTNTLPAPTDTPLPPAILPTATSAQAVIPTTGCDAAQFVSDVTVPDGTAFTGGTAFVKTWRLKNIGSCTWNSSYALVYDSGNAMGGPTSQALGGTTAPGATLDVSVNLVAPAADGSYRGFWGVTNAAGARIPVSGGSNGKSFYVDIKVGTGSSGGTDSPGKFAVTSVQFSINRSGSCASTKYDITATITVNKAGTVNYTWIRSDAITSPGSSLTFDSAGSQTITFSLTFGGGNRWVDLYIDKPNHQQFGRANLNCP